MSQSNKKIGLVLFAEDTNEKPLKISSRRFLEEFIKAGYEPQILYHNLFSIFFKQNKIEIYYDNKKFDPKKYFYFQIQYYFWTGESLISIFIAESLRQAGGKVFNSPEAVKIAKSKRETLMLLSRKNFPIIPTGVNCSQFFLDEQIKHFGKNKIVVKTTGGSQGYGVSVLDSPISFISFMEFIGNIYQPSNILIQPFINSNNEDYRVFVVGNRVVATMKRKAQGIEFRANISKGGAGIKITPSKKMANLAIRAVKTLGLDYAGVDIMKDKQGKLMIVEVNPTPGLKIEEATGVNVSGEIVKYCIKKAK